MAGHIKIGTRGSALALAQAKQAADQLAEHGVFETYELVVIKTTGDRIQDRSLAEIGGKGLFIKEIEEALLDGRVSLAIHSMKDLPGFVAPGTVLAGALLREDPSDTLITRGGESRIEDLPEGACLGTSSLRRQFQAKVLRPDLEVVPLRGNVDTRLRKLNQPERQFDATILPLRGSRASEEIWNMPIPSIPVRCFQPLLKARWVFRFERGIRLCGRPLNAARIEKQRSRHWRSERS